MKNNKINERLFVWLLLTILCFSCTQSEVVTGDGDVIGEEVSACLRLNILASTIAQTRSMTFTEGETMEADSVFVSSDAVTRSVADPGETADKTIQNLWVGQYNAAGELVAEEYFSSLSTQESVNLPLKRIDGTCHVWVVANAGNLQGKAVTETLLKELQTSNAFTEDGLPVSNLCIMTGMWSGTITENISVDIHLKRSLAKIKFTYSVGGENFSFVPATLELCNVSVHLKYIGDETPEQVNGEEDFKTYTTLSPGSSGTYYWYVPENPAGTGSNTENVATNKIGEGVTHATCIRLTGEAVQNGVTYSDVAFTLYPGNGNNEYNIVRNGLYTIDITLTGIDFSDKRVTVGTVPEMQDPENLGAGKGTTGMFQVTTRPGLPWSFVIPSWLSAVVGERTYESGTRLDFVGPYQVEFQTTTANPRAEEREISFTVGGKEITVRQNPSSLTAGSSISLSAEGNSVGSSIFKATKGLPWSAVLSSEWGNWLEWNGIIPTSGTEATGGNESLAIKAISSNPSSSYRKGTILLKGGDAISDAGYPGLIENISVTQAGATISVTDPTPNPGPEAATKLSDSFVATHELPWVATVTNGTDWLSLLNPQNGTTGASSQTINYKTTLNLNATDRKGIITIHVGNEAGDTHPGPSANITVTQKASVVNVSPATLELENTATSGTVTLSGTNGLPWTVSRTSGSEEITVSPLGGTLANVTQTLTFSASENTGDARSATFTVGVTGGNHSKIVTVNQAVGLSAFDLEINKESLTLYNNWLGAKLSSYPPFANEEDLDYNNRKTLINEGGAYVIQVQKAQKTDGGTLYGYANYYVMSSYCSYLEEDGYTDWRLPTMIELKVMLENRNKIEEGNGCEPFITLWYWSSSVYLSDKNQRCVISWGSGDPGQALKAGNGGVRCVRDKK